MDKMKKIAEDLVKCGYFSNADYVHDVSGVGIVYWHSNGRAEHINPLKQEFDAYRQLDALLQLHRIEVSDRDSCFIASNQRAEYGVSHEDRRQAQIELIRKIYWS